MFRGDTCPRPDARKSRYLASISPYLMRSILLVPLLGLTIVGSSPAAAAGFSFVSGVVAPPRVPRPAVIPGVYGHSAAATPSYTIADYGAPSAGAYSEAQAYAFNNTGQIIGTAMSTTTKTQHCIIYNGIASPKFIDVLGAGSTLNCTPQGISGLTGSNNVNVVGTLSSTYIEPYAFSAKIGTTGTTGTASSRNLYSELTGVNLSGQAVGDAYYNPPGGFFTNDPLFVSVGKGITVAQPSCVTYAQGCSINIGGAASFGYYSTCPFGGCDINDSGTVLAVDNTYLLTFPFASTTNTKHLVQCSNSTEYCVYQSMINNANQVVYDEYVVATGAFLAFFYPIGTGKALPIPFLPKSTCTTQSPISLSNTGVVFGESNNCSDSSDNVYFIWTQTNGTRNLNALIPTSANYSAIYPIAINDRGQVLVDLVLSGGAVHWGVLNPV